MKRVLSVGQCLADHGSISRTFAREFGVEVVAARHSRQAQEMLGKEEFALVLVNRIFDADGFSGIAWIEQTRTSQGHGGPPIMLVSNYEEAQQQAIEAGAEPGFGKSELGRPAMLERVRPFLGGSNPTS